jgi:hypothetical protein
MYYKNKSEKIMVTIELQEYQYLKDFYYKCESKDVFMFDDWHKIICYTDKDVKMVDNFNTEIRWKDDKINSLINKIDILENQTLKQKLKNLFK